MKPKHQRLIMIILGLLCLGGAAFLILSNLRDNLVFFYSPSELFEKKPQGTIRIGGLVAEGSIVYSRDGKIQFTLTDTQKDITVTYQGILPNLFREQQGIVATGSIAYAGDSVSFTADELLAKHDENYMPPEVVDALKKSGNWRHYEKGNTTNTPNGSTP